MAHVKNNIQANTNYVPEITIPRFSYGNSPTASINTVKPFLPPIQIVQVGVRCPASGVDNIFVVESTESVGNLRRHAVSRSKLDIEEAINFGLYLPPHDNKKGKFLEEERPIADYPILLQSGGRRSRDTDETASTVTATATVTNDQQNSPDSGVGQEPCWLELIFKARVDSDDLFHQSRIKKLKTKVTQGRFMDAVRSGDVKGIEKLLVRGFDPNFWSRKDGEAPITAAAALTKPRGVIIALVNGGAHIDFRARDSHTALHRAAINGNYEAIMTLLDLGQNPNCRDSVGLTPLYYAVSTDISARCTHALLYDHAILGVEDENGFQEIHQACKANRSQHLENLIAYGADLNARTRRGQTPLHLCVRYEADACLCQLLLRGADANQLNEDNQTPLEYALLINRNEQARILRTFNPADVVPIREAPSYNKARRPMVNGPRGAVAYSMQHRGSETRTNTDNGALYSGILSPAESLFSADRMSVTSFGPSSTFATNNVPDSMPRRSRSLRTIYHPQNDDFALNEVEPPRQIGGTPKMTRFNVNEGHYRNIAAPNRFPSALSEVHDEKTHVRTVAMHKSSEGFGFTLNGIPRKALLRHGRQPLPNTPSNQYFSSVVPGGPADRAGVREGDYVLEIDGYDVTGVCHEDAVERIKDCGDSLFMRVMSVYRPSTLHQPNGRAEMAQISLSSRKLLRRPAISELNDCSSSSENEDNARAASSIALRNPPDVLTGCLQKRQTPLAVEERSRGRGRENRTRAERARSSDVRKETPQLHATSPAENYTERVFVFVEIDGKTRAVPLEASRASQPIPRSKSAVRFADYQNTPPSMEKRLSYHSSSDADDNPSTYATSTITIGRSNLEKSRSLSLDRHESDEDSSTATRKPRRVGMPAWVLRRTDNAKDAEVNTTDAVNVDNVEEEDDGRIAQSFAARRKLRAENSRSLSQLNYL